MIYIPEQPGLDASTAILLHKANLLPAVLNEFTIHSTRTVLEEIKAGMDGHRIAALFQDRVHDCAESGDFDPGENSLLALYRTGSIDALFTDDGACLRHCRKNEIPHFSAIMMPWLLWQQETLDRKTALNYFDTIRQLGHYSDWVVKYAQELWERED